MPAKAFIMRIEISNLLASKTSRKMENKMKKKKINNNDADKYWKQQRHTQWCRSVISAHAIIYLLKIMNSTIAVIRRFYSFSSSFFLFHSMHQTNAQSIHTTSLYEIFYSKPDHISRDNGHRKNKE